MSTVNLEVIDRFFSAQLSANESEETLKTLRPQMETAAKHPKKALFDTKRSLKVIR